MRIYKCVSKHTHTQGYAGHAHRDALDAEIGATYKLKLPLVVNPILAIATRPYVYVCLCRLCMHVHCKCWALRSDAK